MYIIFNNIVRCDTFPKYKKNYNMAAANCTCTCGYFTHSSHIDDNGEKVFQKATRTNVIISNSTCYCKCRQYSHVGEKTYNSNTELDLKLNYEMGVAVSGACFIAAGMFSNATEPQKDVLMRCGLTAIVCSAVFSMLDLGLYYYNQNKK